MKKKILKTVLAMVLSTTLVLSSVAMVFGAETKEVMNEGVLEYSDEGESMGPPQVVLEITNITGMGDEAFSKVLQETKESILFGGSRSYYNYVGQTPITITLKTNKHFRVYKIKDGFPNQETVYNAGSLNSWRVNGETTREMLPIKGELIPDQSGFFYNKGATATIATPGFYCVEAEWGGRHDISGVVVYINIPDSNISTETAVEKPQKPTSITAKANSSKVMVNGTETAFEAYNIDGNNYFKLRDFAKVVSGTEKQFEVTYDNASKAINLVSNKAYTVAGGELVNGDGKDKQASLSNSPISKDGQPVALTAYTIGGNNYFKLRDIAKAFDMGVTYDNATKTIGIDTSVSYVE